MFRYVSLLLGSTLLAMPTLVPTTPTMVTPQVLHSGSDTMFAMPVSTAKQVAPAKDTDSPTPAYSSNGGAYTATTGSTGGFGSGGYGTVYARSRLFNRVRRNYVPNPTIAIARANGCNCSCPDCTGGPNCPCNCPDCICNDQQVATGPVGVYRTFAAAPLRRGLFGGRWVANFRSRSCPSCGN